MDFTPIHKIIQYGFKESHIHNLTGSIAALLFALCDEPFFVVELTEELAQELCNDINFFRDALKKDHVLFLPEPDGPARAGERAHIISSFDARVSLISSFRNIGKCTWSRADMQRSFMHLAGGLEISRNAMDTRLQEIGYRHCAVVSEKGEFSRRGWLLDVFPSTSEVPLRLEFFGDEIESIKTFDVEAKSGTDAILVPSIPPIAGTVVPRSLLSTTVLLLAIVIIGCSTDSVQPRHVPATLVPSHELPGFSDDLGLEGLSTAIQRQLALLRKERDREALRIGEHSYRTERLLVSLERFNRLLSATDICLKQGETSANCYVIFSQQVRNHFLVYRISPSLLTAYYTPIIEVSTQPTDRFRYPIYRAPDTDWERRLTRGY